MVCVLRVCVAVSFNVLVCNVCALLFEVAWCVVAWFVAVCDFMCGVVWFVLFVCSGVVCCALFVRCCLMVNGLCVFVCV